MFPTRVGLIMVAVTFFGARTTANRADEIARRIDAEKLRLLEKLGLGDRVPDVSVSKLTLNRHLISTNDDIGDMEEERIVIANLPDDPHCLSSSGEFIPNCFYFKVDPNVHHVSAASLVFTFADATDDVTVGLREIDHSTGNAVMKQLQRFAAGSGDSAQMDITNLVREWVSQQTGAHTLQLLRCEACNEREDCERCDHSQFVDTREEVSPILQITVPTSPSYRLRRSSSCAPDGSCCLHHMHINFTEIGFSDFIIAPTGYQANYCAGRCTPHHEGDYRHRVLKNVKHMKEPCCAPTKYDSLEILYAVGKNDIRKRQIVGMKVSECGCLV